jgi:hypothetical protein
MSRILSVYGPFKGAASDIKIFESGLLAVLSPDELVVADRGYFGAPQCVTMKKGQEHNENERILNHHRQKVENLYSRFEHFAICTSKWRGTEQEHALMVNVLCRMLNISFVEDPLRSDEKLAASSSPLPPLLIPSAAAAADDDDDDDQY